MLVVFILNEVKVLRNNHHLCSSSWVPSIRLAVLVVLINLSWEDPTTRSHGAGVSKQA